jgi:hypothetical protein
LPGIDQPDNIFHVRDSPSDVTLRGFSVTLPTGASTLVARYRARAAGTDEHRPTVTWLFPYVLAPAREWGSFGGLDVTAYVPDGWEAASTPALEREGEVLRGSFTGLPADNLVLAARAPPPPGVRWAMCLWMILYLIVFVGGGFLCLTVGRWLGHLLARTMPTGKEGEWPGLWIVVVAILMTSAWMAALYGTGNRASRQIHAAFAGQESPYFHWELFVPSCVGFLLLEVALPVGLVATSISAYRARNRAERRRAGAAGRWPARL